MKKILAFLLVFLYCISFTACSPNTNNNDDDTTILCQIIDGTISYYNNNAVMQRRFLCNTESQKQKNLFLINRLNILVAPNISPQIAPKRKQAINM